ncbi:MAG: dihydroorotate dehydrogenase electron transfer subunit [Deltaproteobacteria bacterium]|nr:dihydroorotate dehydrogenase electron transfer subunit [Deltaproteobacteria bacterium]
MVANESYGHNHFKLRFEWSGGFAAGQFFMLGELAKDSFILPRAFSAFRGDHNSVEVVYKVVGRGTHHLAEMRAGDDLLAWGPLGNGFRESTGPELLVAGGIGIAGLFARAEALARSGHRAALVFGGRTESDLVGRRDLDPIVSSATYFTEDGSFGEKGRVTNGLAETLKRGGFRSLAACGPAPMLDAVALIARDAGVRAQLSVEAPMACGMGVCLGCSVAVDGRYARACTEGPVFDAAYFGVGPR